MSQTLFLFCCIPVRLLLALLTYKLSKKYLPYLSIILFTIGFSFMYLYMTNSRLKASEASGKTWWSNLRPVHSMFYLTAALYALKGQNIAALFLLFDVLFGTFAYFYNYSK